MPKPKALGPGSLIRIVTPASPLPEEKLLAAIQLLEAEGYRIEIAPHALERDDYLAGKDVDRAEDLQSAFDDPDVDLVYCARGGYGCARLIPYLDFDRMAASNKLFAGFSDITTIHLALNKRGLPTLHAPMPITLNTNREDWVIASLLQQLKGDASTPANAWKGRAIVEGEAEGESVGGCLCLLCDSIGTPDALDCNGKILFIEDVDENPHRVDAMLTHLLNSGVLRRVKGIVIGEMTRTDERLDEGIGGKPWRVIVEDRLGGLGVPLMIEFPFGHMSQMLTLPLGVKTKMNAGAGTVEFLEAACV